MITNLHEMLAQQVAQRPNATFARFLRYGKVEDACTFGELWELAQRWTTLLIERGLAQDEAVLLCLPNCLDFLGAYFGTIAAGGVPSTTAPPRRARADPTTLQTIAQRCTLARARFVVMTTEQGKVVAPPLALASGGALTVLTRDDLPKTAIPSARPICELGTLQFTSGTSSTPKVVELSQRALLVQAAAIAEWLRVTSEDRAVSWLPFFHDMGLIGFMLAGALRACEMTYLRSDDFLQWIRTVSDSRATITGGPPSAYATCARYAKDSELSGLDLSQLRVALVGAEMISAQSLSAFERKFAPAGFKRSSFQPAYGMAENCLAVTMTPNGRGLLIDEIDARVLQAEGRAEPPTHASSSKRAVVGCGRPITNTSVTIRGVDGELLAERTLGEIVIRSGSLMNGYRDAPTATREALRDGWYWTGDLGYIADGELYVTGRKKEVIIVGGCNYHPEELEALVNSVAGVVPGRTVAIGLEDPVRNSDSVVVLAESALFQTAAGDELRKTIRERLTQADYPVSDVILLRHRTIGTTSSGKLRRLECKTRLLAGEFRQ